MKLNSFFTKSVVRPPQATVFRLGNESREKELEQQISLLQKEVSSLKDTTLENQNLTDKVSVLQVEVRKERTKYNTLHAEMQQQKITLDKLMTIESKYDKTFQDFKTVTTSFKQIQAGFEALQAKDTKHITELTTLNKDYRIILHDYGMLKIEYKKIEDSLTINEKQLAFRTNKLEQVEAANATYSQEKIELENNYEMSLNEIKYWEGTAKAFADKIDTFGLVEQKLQDWITNLTDQNSQETSRSKGALSRLAKSQSLIGDMDTTIQNMVSDQQSLADTNKSLRLQVEKPRYTSMGAMQRMEGFEMAPLGAALNRNKLYLGNGKPSLLKFKSRGQEYDN